jgi:hypothetical protein
MLEFAKAIIVSGTLLYGAANIDPVSTDSVLPTANSNVAIESVSTVFVFAPDHNAPDTFVRDGSQAEADMEQAAEHFDDFVMQIPGVVGKKLESVMKHGMKAVIMQDAETQPAEEKMIGSLVGALKGIGDALAADMVRSAQDTRG